jgi:hypothetical protein
MRPPGGSRLKPGEACERVRWKGRRRALRMRRSFRAEGVVRRRVGSQPFLRGSGIRVATRALLQSCDGSGPASPATSLLPSPGRSGLPPRACAAPFASRSSADDPDIDPPAPGPPGWSDPGSARAARRTRMTARARGGRSVDCFFRLAGAAGASGRHSQHDRPAVGSVDAGGRRRQAVEDDTSYDGLERGQMRQITQ